MNTSSCLIVERGTPFEKGEVIPLYSVPITLGRKGKEWEPNISFNNAFVSRQHASIYYENGQYYIKDLNSKHGTYLNEQFIEPNHSVPLKESDKISLAKDIIVLSFSSSNLEETLDLTVFALEERTNPSLEWKLDSLKQSLIVEGEPYTFSEKEYKCLEILFEKRQQFVSKEEVKKYVWPERVYSLGQIPDVSPEELNALIYRIRKKIHEGISVETIKGKGYILSIRL
ncbi:FHA domain-containing protein [Priestia abyssalis]|uniref:FHA domain-containing protein n=1 Tax=Priestia abyssalis TaxID=1221450 RepID=UPI0009955FAB|nr:FHA domain-containing protein [Priestia abyssalis]